MGRALGKKVEVPPWVLIFSDDFDWYPDPLLSKIFGDDFNWAAIPEMEHIFSEDFSGVWPH